MSIPARQHSGIRPALNVYVQELQLQDAPISTRSEIQLIQELFPNGLIVAGGPPIDSAVLYADEARSIATALDSRIRHFSSGRFYARAALGLLGVEACSIPTNPDRSPCWPNGVVGAITHTDGLVAAVVGSRSVYTGVGIDVESRQRPLSSGIDRLIRTPHERDSQTLISLRDMDLVRLVFSAKESIHKCVAPQSGVTLGFHDVELELNEAHGSFTAELLRRDELLPDFTKLHGRFACTSSFVMTAAWMVT